MALTEAAAELQAVLEAACSALQAQEEARLQDAVRDFFLARSRVRYVAEALLRPLLEAEPDNEDAALTAATCEALEATYAEAVQRLSCGRGGGWEGGGAGLSMQSEEDSFEGGDVAWGGTQLGGGAGFDAPGQGGAARTAGAGLLERRPGGFQGGRAGGVPAVAQRCLRETMGSLDEVVGLAAIKQELREAVLLPMRLPHLFVGIRRPQTNLMFHGAPGTGKTLLVEKLAAEAGTPLLCLSPSAILSKWAGESEQSVRAVFEAAAALSPAIVFIDEIDALAPTRSSGDDLASRRVLTELLIQMTAVTSRPGCMVFVLAATNRMQDCDPALLRRFDRRVEVPAPDAGARAAFFLQTVQRPEIASTLSEEELEALAAATEGCTGSDLAVICREAALLPLRELAQRGGLHPGLSAADVRPVVAADFAAAVAKLSGGGVMRRSDAAD